MADLDPCRLATRLDLPAGHVTDPAELVVRDDSTDLALVDVVVHDPHASVALPVELEEWLAPGLSDRRRIDFSDVASDALGRHWASLDPHVVYVRNPVNRLVLDPNRFRPVRSQLGGQLVEAVRRSRAALEQGTRPSLSGMDAVRPVTFAGWPVLDLDRVLADPETFLDVLDDAAGRTVDVYRATVREVIAQVLAAKRTMLAQVSPADLSAEDAVRLSGLLVVGLHDTSAFTLTADDRLAVPKPVDDTLPTFVDFGTRGDSNADPGIPDGHGGLEPTSMRPEAVRALRQCYVKAFGSARGFTINDPYKGAEETVRFRDEYAVPSRLSRPIVDVVQLEWSRETLYGADGAAALTSPGTAWPEEAMAIDPSLAPRVVEAHDLWRRLRAGLV
ncbi:N-formylglutamate amidohydrolase [Actinotalea sp. M2MS4P-6]|uniref:N-formylglutamate amidohydrolase n=1 Tax=Actinotalea sp. M2MS4P-6 TaxID=2983762 RepID=UPI0021E39242|nr:N-formylglutamate amidohydrolase [Actinotalea sp. M2MS4P-6]MCV2393173.1 N-formylglutamate amidohydrolase [Actinotalea sp. M2MS4P-6]